MKKKRLRFIAWATLVAGSFFGVMTSSIAWFNSSVKIAQNSLKGEALGKYFAYGTGTADDPYGISSPVHLYNLSWLQYMGYFTQTGDGTMYYFELANDISGSGTSFQYIPPIGTEDHPFIGQFDGKGYTIENFVFANGTTSGGEAGISKIPSKVTEGGKTYAPDNNVGIFGVTESLTVEEGEDNTLIKDVGFKNITVKSTDGTNVGILAGTLDCPTENVVFESPVLDIVSDTSGTTTSQYTLAGNVDDKYTHTVKKTKQDVYDLEVKNIEFTAQNSGKENDWGGSVDFKEVHTRLNHIRKNYAKVYTTRSYPKHEVITFDPDGEVYSDAFSLGSASFFPEAMYNDGGRDKDNNGTAISNYNSTKGSYDPMIGAYAFSATDSGGSTDTSKPVPQAFHYMAGGHWTERRYREEYEYTGYKITDGTHFLGLSDNGSLIPNGTADQGSVWVFTTDGSTNCAIYTYTSSGTRYYLNRSSSSLSVNTSRNTYWRYSDSGSFRTIRTSDNYYLYYNDDSNNWTLSTNVPGSVLSEYYLIYDDSGNYMQEPTSYRVRSTTSRNDAAKWSLISNTTNQFALQGNSSARLGYYGSSYPVQAASDTRANYQFSVTAPSVGETATGTFSCTYNSSTFWVVKQNDSTNPWGATENDQSATRLTIEHVYSETVITTQATPEVSDEYVKVNGDRTTAGMDYSDQDVTYFPLNVNGKNDKGLDPYYPTENNTGYIIGATPAMSSLSGTYGLGAVRVGAYEFNYSNSSDERNYCALVDFDHSSGKFKTIYTRNASGTAQKIINNGTDNSASFHYQKFADSREKIEKVLNGTDIGQYSSADIYTTSGSDNVYGLHFMQNQINMNYLVTARKAQVNGTIKTNYEMPASSIDFNLKEKGYVNFFAGTYYYTTSWQTVDNFFSLFDIFRYPSDDPTNPDKIYNIRRITKIWFDNSDTTKNKTHSYVYQYETDGGTTYYSVPYWFNTNGEKCVINSDGQTTNTPYEINSITTTKPSTYSYSVFDTSWIEYLAAGYGQRLCYYFEIPMNSGEFALGSVNTGKNSSSGAYLIYLDIGANAVTVDRTVFIQKIEAEVYTFKFVEGVTIVENAKTSVASLYTTTTVEGVTTRNRNSNDIDSSGAIAVNLQTGYTDTISISRSGEVMTISRAGPPAKATLTYADKDVTVNVDGVATSPDNGVTPVTKTLVVVDYYDVNTNNMSVTHTILTYDDSDVPTEIKQYLNNSETAVTSGTESLFNDSGVSLSYEQIAALAPLTNSQTTKCMSIEYYATDGADVQLVGKLVAALNGMYYQASGYTFTFSNNGEDFEVEVTAINGSLRVFINRGTSDAHSTTWTCAYTIVIDGVPYVVSTTTTVPSA